MWHAYTDTHTSAHTPCTHTQIRTYTHIHTQTQTDTKERRAIHIAALNNSAETLEVITSHDDVDRLDTFNCTPMHYAIRRIHQNPEDYNCIKILLQHGSRIDIADYEGFSVNQILSSPRFFSIAKTFYRIWKEIIKETLLVVGVE